MSETLKIPPELLFFGTRTAVALLVGLIIGVERTLNFHATGIKTLVFVSIGSCLFTTLSFYLKDVYIGSDPTRILGQVASGIGFIGGGVILHNSDKVQGLTSAALVFVVAALGMLAGSGLFIAPVIIALFIVVIILFLRWFENMITKKFRRKINQNE